MELTKKKCIPCEGGIPPLKENELLEYITLIKGWTIQGDKKIIKEFSFVNFKHTMDFVNKVAEISENEGHHPVMTIEYGKAIIELWTHAINGLSENDFIVAAKIDKI